LARFKSGGGGAVQCMLILSVGSPEMTFGPPPQQHRLCAGRRRTIRLGTCAAYAQRTAAPPRPVPSVRQLAARWQPQTPLATAMSSAAAAATVAAFGTTSAIVDRRANNI